MVERLHRRVRALFLWDKGKGTLNKLRLLWTGILLQWPRRLRGRRVILLLNRALRDVVIQGAYRRLFHLQCYDDLGHTDHEFEKDIKEWFDVSGGAFIDIGANIGRYTVGLAENFTNVYAFEPVRETFMTLEKNIRLNGLGNVTAMQIGLWSCCDEKDIHIGLQSGLSSIVLTLPHSHTRKIIVNPLDKIVESLDIHDVALVKIDAEGAEAEIIDGMERLLLRDSPRVIVEVKGMNLEKVLSLFGRLGYTLIDVKGENYLFENRMSTLTRDTYDSKMFTLETESFTTNMIL